MEADEDTQLDALQLDASQLDAQLVEGSENHSFYQQHTTGPQTPQVPDVNFEDFINSSAYNPESHTHENNQKESSPTPIRIHAPITMVATPVRSAYRKLLLQRTLLA